MPLLDRDPGLALDSGQEIPQRAGKLLAGGDRFLALRSRQAVEQLAADMGMLDVRILVDSEEPKRLFVVDAVAVDQAFDLGAGDGGELALVGIERAESGRV